MLAPGQMEDAGGLVAAAYRQVEAEMLEYLVAKMIEGDVAGQRARTAMLLLSQTMPLELRKVIDAHAGEIDAAVRKDVERSLEASDAFDLAAISDGLGVSLAADALAVQTLSVAASVRGVLERDNLEMTTAARSKFVQWSTWAATQVATGNMTPAHALHRAARELARGGITMVSYRDPETGNPTVTNRADVAVQRHVRTLIAQGAAQLTEQRCDEAGVEFVEVSSHVGSRPSHAAWHGRVYHRGGAVEVDGVRYEDFEFGTGYKGTCGPYTALGDQLLGVNCVMKGTEVWGPSPRAIYRREYSGEIVTIRTALGHRLAVTPNHPILTPQGWMPAHFLNQGSHVFSAFLSDGVPCGARPNDHERPTAIEEVFNARRDAFEVHALLGSAGDFHGDGITNREVEVVLIDVPLIDDRQPTSLKHGTETFLHDAAGFTDGRLRRSTLDETRMGALHAPHRIMSGSSERAALFGSHAGKSRAHRVASALGRKPPLGKPLADNHIPGSHADSDVVLADAGFVQPHDLVIVEGKASSVGREANLSHSVRDNLAADAKSTGDIGSAETFLVQLDEVVEVNVDSGVTCHVYNLETESGWYFAGDIVTHNCRHSFGPWVPGSPRAYSPDPEHPSGLDNDEIYDLTQRQRERERGICATKRELAAAQRLYDADPTVENQVEVAKLKAKLRNQQAGMREFIREANARCKPGTEVLVRQPQREWAGDMPKGKVALPEPSKRTLDEFLGMPSVERAREAAGMTRAELHGRMREHMGVGKGERDGFAYYSTAQQRNALAETLHAAERKAERGVTDEQVADALANPLHRKPVKIDSEGRPSYQVVGRDATVAVNPDTGAVVSAWRTGSKRRERYEKNGNRETE